MVRAGPIRCVTCKKPASYRFCSDDCFEEYSKTRIGIDCSICRYDPATKRAGSLKTSRICGECSSDDPANGAWKDVSRKERRGFEVDEFEAGANRYEPKQYQKFYTPLAQKVIRCVSGGMSVRMTAEETGCNFRYVAKVCSFWNKETNGALKELHKENK